MTYKQKFIYIHLVECKLYEVVSKEMGVSRQELFLWYEELKLERTAIASY